MSIWDRLAAEAELGGEDDDENESMIDEEFAAEQHRLLQNYGLGTASEPDLDAVMEDVEEKDDDGQRLGGGNGGGGGGGGNRDTDVVMGG